jgi:hypothetical protein
MELDIAQNVYENYNDRGLSFSEFAFYIRTGIILWEHSKTFPSDPEAVKAIKIAIIYRDKLIQLFPLKWKNYFKAQA